MGAEPEADASPAAGKGLPEEKPSFGNLWVSTSAEKAPSLLTVEATENIVVR